MTGAEWDWLVVFLPSDLRRPSLNVNNWIPLQICLYHSKLDQFLKGTTSGLVVLDILIV